MKNQTRRSRPQPPPGGKSQETVVSSTESIIASIIGAGSGGAPASLADGITKM